MQLPTLASPASARLASEAAAARDTLVPGDGAARDAAAARFESLLATTLVRELRRALPDGFFGDGESADVYGGWFDEHLGEAVAASGALDLAGLIRTGIDAKVAEEGP